MKTGSKKIASIILSLILCFSLGITANADEISEAEQKAKEIENQKNAAEEEAASLSANLQSIIGEMEATQKKVHVKLEEITQKESELGVARANANEQYEAMKLRIRFMYESGNAQFVEVLVNSKNIGEFLNNAEYIKTVSEYDRDMLTQYEKTVNEMEKQEADLKAEYQELESLQSSLVEKQDNVESMLSQKNQEIGSLDTQLKEQSDKLASLKEAAAQAARMQQERENAASSSGGGSVYTPGGGTVVSGNGQFAHPLPGAPITCPFGYRTDPIAGGGQMHLGTDFGASMGTPIYAAEAGTVTLAGYDPSAGNWIIINHGNGLLTYYMHASALHVQAGETVERGQNIAAVGTTGYSTGPHLHFQVMVNGSAVDATSYL
ncbi:murein DD-endopeptidase MepM/ murein hydrolase activator NlpD [Aequitasia blattaphilus]|uniref:Peptidoglycan DD-metalloendopeptidase family protein n=1 Tax=Aequitasia blattaphilus TaxID=2949332 RepID=A0ABT1E9Y0_9FIRM|nr:M23 family metallopeptidase [Aequitasia blattaphilus]MCP1102630.1 peptidoglycan DD-metalloendopeptidase family protein [Aequitasia blattaphilus]MCR8615270.1 peptidoglycan DD-metalloendopeptidase family protein [Aequitasia blattaphilus]